MPSISEIQAALRGVVDPELGSDIVDLGMVPNIELNDEGDAVVHVALTIAACPMRDQIENDVLRKVSAMPGIRNVSVEVTAMTQSQRSDLMERARFKAREEAAPTQVNPMTRVVAVGSGKGGVGKSSVSVNLAVALNELGYKVGLLDADIWGFLGATDAGHRRVRLEANADSKIVPEDAAGIQVVSTGLLVDDEGTALMWRGLMLSKALEQFLQDVAWDPKLDYLVLDLPPGTGDIQMALARLLPQAEMVVVTTPQQAAQKVAARVADMARRSYMPVVGIIENMVRFHYPERRTLRAFRVGRRSRNWPTSSVFPMVAQIPLDPFVVAGRRRGQAGRALTAPVAGGGGGAPRRQGDRATGATHRG